MDYDNYSPYQSHKNIYIVFIIILIRSPWFVGYL